MWTHVPWHHQSLGRHRRKSPSHTSPPSPRASESPSSRGHRPVLGSLRRKWGEARICIWGTPSHSRQHPGPGSCLLVPTPGAGYPDLPICRQSGPRFPFPTESGNGGFPDSRFRPRPSRDCESESGIPLSFQIPGPGPIGNGGNGGNWPIQLGISRAGSGVPWEREPVV